MKTTCLRIASSLLTAFPFVHAGVDIIPTNGRNIYRLAVAELDGEASAKEIVGSTYDNRVCAFTLDGKHLWDAPTGGFVFDLAAGDLDGDGRDEIIAASADGVVLVVPARSVSEPRFVMAFALATESGRGRGTARGL